MPSLPSPAHSLCFFLLLRLASFAPLQMSTAKKDVQGTEVAAHRIRITLASTKLQSVEKGTSNLPRTPASALLQTSFRQRVHFATFFASSSYHHSFVVPKLADLLLTFFPTLRTLIPLVPHSRPRLSPASLQSSPTSSARPATRRSTSPAPLACPPAA